MPPMSVSRPARGRDVGGPWADPTAQEPIPVAHPDSANVAVSSTVRIFPLANDEDPAAGGLTIIDAGPPTGAGTSTFTATYVDYTSAATTGTDRVPYTVQDANGRQASSYIDISITSGDGQTVGELSGMKLVATGAHTAELRFSSTVAGTMRLCTTYWDDANTKAQIDAKDKKGNPRPEDHFLRGTRGYWSPSYLFMTHAVVAGDNVIPVDNSQNIRGSGSGVPGSGQGSAMAKGMRIAAHFYIVKTDGTQTQDFHSNEVYLYPTDMEGDFGNGWFHLTAPDAQTFSVTVSGGDFPGTYSVPLPLTAPVILGNHKPKLTGTGALGATATVAPPPMVWPNHGLWTAQKKWNVPRKPKGKIRWIRDGVLVSEVDVIDDTDLSRTLSVAGSWTAEYLETQSGVTLAATSNALIVS